MRFFKRNPVNAPLLMKRKAEALNKFIIAHKNGDAENISYYRGQIDLAKEILGDKG